MFKNKILVEIPTNALSTIYIDADEIEGLEDLGMDKRPGVVTKTAIHMKSRKTFLTKLHVTEVMRRINNVLLNYQLQNLTNNIMGNVEKELTRIDKKQNQAIFVLSLIAVITLIVIMYRMNDLNSRVLILESQQRNQKMTYDNRIHKSYETCDDFVPVQKNK